MKSKHILHLYNRIGFGITPKNIEALKLKSKVSVINTLFETSKETTPLLVDTSFLNGFKKNDLKSKKKRKALMKISRKKIKELNVTWIERLANPKELLREKMTLFWANHFVCKDNNIVYLQHYNNTLRENSLGNFESFVKTISKEAAMLKYLNNKQNLKASPNENFARELMELFTLGQGNYTERDIKESARAFTGYTHSFSGDFKIRRKHHDTGKKTFLNETGNFNGDHIITIILKQRKCAEFICNKIYKYFVNDIINSKHIEEMTSVFYPSYNIEELMRHIFMSEWFYDDVNIGTKIKSPIELLVGLQTVVPHSLLKDKQLILLQKLLGQTLLNPPNVAGWQGGKTWIDSNTIVTRLRLPSVLLNNAQIVYSEKGDFKDTNTNLKEKKLQKKAFIKTNVRWSTFEYNYKSLTLDELTSAIIVSPINNGTKGLLKNYTHLSKKDFCVQLVSLPEYQLC